MAKSLRTWSKEEESALRVAMVAVLAALSMVGCDAADVVDGGDVLVLPPNLDGGAAGPDTRHSHLCERIAIGANPDAIPNVHIVLDKSTSMRLGRLWPQAVSAVESLTESLDERIAFGLRLFPETEPFGPMPTIEDVCVAGSSALPMSVGNAGEIRSMLSSAFVDGNTPTAATLDIARRSITGPDQSPPVVLLVTDGAPNCAATRPATCLCTADTRGPCPDHLCVDPGAVTAVEALAESGVRTYVVGFQTSLWRDTLNAMARAGDTGRTEHFLAQDRAGLEAAFEEITGTILECSYELDTAPADLSYVRVVVDGEPIRYESDDPEAGWRVLGDKTIELMGDTCTRLRAGGSHRVEISVECEQQTLI